VLYTSAHAVRDKQFTNAAFAKHKMPTLFA